MNLQPACVGHVTHKGQLDTQVLICKARATRVHIQRWLEIYDDDVKNGATLIAIFLFRTVYNSKRNPTLLLLFSSLSLPPSLSLSFFLPLFFSLSPSFFSRVHVLHLFMTIIGSSCVAEYIYDCIIKLRELMQIQGRKQSRKAQGDD